MEVTPQPRTTGTGPDAAVIQRVLGGDRSAFGILYAKYVKRIFGLAYRMVGTQEAEEVTQEVFLQVYRALPGFKGGSQLYTWIYRIATNVALQHVKKRMRQRREVPLDVEVASSIEDVGSGRASPQRVAEARDLYTALHKGISTLPPSQRIVMILGPIQGHSYEQMAWITGTSTDVIKGRLHRARVNIRAFLTHLR